MDRQEKGRVSKTAPSYHSQVQQQNTVKHGGSADKGEISGLGDDLMDTIAASSGSDACMVGAKVNGSKSGSGPKGSSLNSIDTVVGSFTSAVSANANGRGRRKRKPRTKTRGRPVRFYQ